jgi:hypothetical protein
MATSWPSVIDTKNAIGASLPGHDCLAVLTKDGIHNTVKHLPTLLPLYIYITSTKLVVVQVLYIIDLIEMP